MNRGMQGAAVVEGAASKTAPAQPEGMCTRKFQVVNLGGVKGRATSHRQQSYKCSNGATSRYLTSITSLPFWP
jgi:hypothetical protein